MQLPCYGGQVQGTVTEIQRFSIHDGPGIRTTLFLKGCPLHCPWCHNPETIRPEPEVLFYPDHCIACGRCVAICPDHHRLEDGRLVHDRASCDCCLEAARECPTGALRVSGETREASAVVASLLRDRLFFAESGGGVTVSGGEPLAQSVFTRAILAEVRSQGVHTCVDTSLSGEYEPVQSVAEVTDLFLVDCKETDADRHLDLTGAPMASVRSNLERLSSDGGRIWLRCPIVPGEHDRNDHLSGIGALADSVPGVEEVWLLPFHQIARHKWDALGRANRYAHIETPSDEELERYASIVASHTGKPVRFAESTAPSIVRSGQ